MMVLMGCLAVSNARGQYYFYNENYYDSPVIFELGGSAGGMNCLTDLGGKKGIGKKFVKDINWNQTNAGGGLYAAAMYHNFLSARLELAFGRVNANDDVLKKDMSAAYGRAMRHLSFRSGITETSMLIEFYPIAVINPESSLMLSPFLSVGGGIFRFSPEASYNGTWVSLPALHTEGQGFLEYPERKIYPLTQINLPFGAGLRYECSPSVAFRLELVYRKLWTDYLDDVSKSYVEPAVFNRYFTPELASMARKLADRRLTPASEYQPGDIRGNDKNNDAYFSVNLKIGLILGRQKRH